MVHSCRARGSSKGEGRRLYPNCPSEAGEGDVRATEGQGAGVWEASAHRACHGHRGHHSLGLEDMCSCLWAPVGREQKSLKPGDAVRVHEAEEDVWSPTPQEGSYLRPQLGQSDDSLRPISQ